jgi:hypothetical protein
MTTCLRKSSLGNMGALLASVQAGGHNPRS